jgi:hypothetical protein
MQIHNLVYIWYHVGYVKITVIHLDFLKVTFCNFYKITVSHRDSDIFNVIPNIDLVYIMCLSYNFG